MSLFARQRGDGGSSASATGGGGATASTLKVWSHAPVRRKRASASAATTASSCCSSLLTRLLVHSASAEKATIGLLLLIAWGWIMVTIGMVFYHGYYHRGGSSPGYSYLHKHYLPGFGPPKAPDFQPGRGVNSNNNNNNNAAAVASSGNAAVVPRPPQQAGQLDRGASPLLIFTYKRSDYLRTTLEDVLRYIPHDCRMGCPVVISQDGTFEDVTGVIREFQSKFEAIGIPCVHWQHPQQQAPPQKLRGAAQRPIVGAAAYRALAQHYKWALDKLFVEPHDNTDPAWSARSRQRAIILEEDLHIAPDFFDYFTAVAPLLDRDSSLLAASAYNDNGYEGTVQDTTRLLRSDFFPGLGWCMTQRLWVQELSAKWPEAYWDDWLREPVQRQGRHVIRPEVSRTLHFGVKGGASQNQFGKQLTKIWLNPSSIDWPQEEPDLSYLAQDRFDHIYWHLVQSAQTVATVQEAKQSHAGNVRLEYRSQAEFIRLAKPLGLFTDEKAGVPRTAYKGIVETRVDGARLLFLTPPLEQMQHEFEENPTNGGATV